MSAIGAMCGRSRFALYDVLWTGQRPRNCGLLHAADPAIRGRQASLSPHQPASRNWEIIDT
jgi:hypothetical protein